MTVVDQAALAKWCKKNRLPDEERVHWLLTLQLQPDNAEAIKGLGLHSYQGMLLTNSQIAECRALVQAFKKAMEHWRPIVAQWSRDIKNRDRPDAGADMSNVRKISTSAEMLALERVVWQHVDARKNNKRLYEALSQELILELKEMPQQAAVESLARHAVFSPSATVRMAATSALKERAFDRYVPILLSGLWVGEAKLTYTPVGRNPVAVAEVRIDLSQEGVFADSSVSLTEYIVHMGGTGLRCQWGLLPTESSQFFEAIEEETFAHSDRPRSRRLP